MHKYDHHIGDYDRDTSHLTLLEHGVYRRLLDRYYADESLSGDHEQLARKLGARSSTEKAAVKTILGEFFQVGAQGWVHKRVEEEIHKNGQRVLKARFSQVQRWFKENNWANPPTLETYLANPAAYHEPITGHIRQPIETDTTVSRTNESRSPTFHLPPSTFHLPPESIAPASADATSDGSVLPSGSTSVVPERSEPAKKEKAPRQRNPLFDCLARVTGSDPERITKTEGGRIGTALGEIRRACPDLTETDLKRAAVAYREMFPDPTVACTPTALASHWSKLHRPAKKEEPAAVSTPSNEPEGWQSVWPEFSDEPAPASWADVQPATLRGQILSHIKASNPQTQTT